MDIVLDGGTTLLNEGIQVSGCTVDALPCCACVLSTPFECVFSSSFLPILQQLNYFYAMRLCLRRTALIMWSVNPTGVYNETHVAFILARECDLTCFPASGLVQVTVGTHQNLRMTLPTSLCEI